MDVKSGRHVVIGASKGIGNAIARELVAQNRPVRAVTRGAANGAFALPEAVEFLGRAYSNLGEYDKAEAALPKAI